MRPSIGGAGRTKFDPGQVSKPSRQTRSAGAPPGNFDRLPSMKLIDGSDVDITRHCDVASGCATARGSRLRGDVCLDYEDFPRMPVGIAGPDLVLKSMAAIGTVFCPDVEFGGAEAIHRCKYALAVANLNAQVRKTGRARRLVKRQLQRGIVQIEIRIPGPDLGGFGLKKIAIKGDRAIEVANIE